MESTTHFVGKNALKAERVTLVLLEHLMLVRSRDDRLRTRRRKRRGKGKMRTRMRTKRWMR